MSYGNQSNAAWQRNMMQGHAQSGSFHQGSQMYMHNAQQTNMVSFGHSGGMQGISNANMFPGGGAGSNSISYPQPRSGLNPLAFQQGSASSQSQYNSIGTVTKMNSDCGLVNNEVFFYRNVCKGSEPKVGDRVIFEASFSNSGQFKWNATRIQLMLQPQPLISSNKTSYSAVQPPTEYQRGEMRRNSSKRSPVRGRVEGEHRDKVRLRRSRDNDEIEQERKKRREDRSRDRGVVAGHRGTHGTSEGRSAHAVRVEKERDYVDSRKKDNELSDREREKEKDRPNELEVHRRGVPKGRRTRAVKRYMVQIPKSLLTIKIADVLELRQRYKSLYIPSDFFTANIKWSDTFTADNPLSLRRPCQFHLMHEMVDSATEQNVDLLEPADANYSYSAKVMLMSLPSIAEIYKKSFDNDDVQHKPIHPSCLIKFLVGVKGRVGSMAIGGPWSPSLDGENPDKDPSVLIRTAIRTCKALTGIDLSNCTQWYRFLELYYYRTEYKNMEKDGPPRVETVVIYLPDVHSCMPSIEEWQTLTQVYKNAADNVIDRKMSLLAAAASNTKDDDDNDQSNDIKMMDNSALAEGNADEGTVDCNFDAVAEEEDATSQNEDEQEDNMDYATSAVDSTGEAEDDCAEVEEQTENKKTGAEDENDNPAPEPTHYSLLDLKNMKVEEICNELLARNLSYTGVRNIVMARLAKALNLEKSEEIKNRNNKPVTIKKQKSPSEKMKISKDKTEEENKEDWADVIDFELSDIVILDEYDSKKNTEELSDKEKARIIRHHTLPSTPHIVVHPNRKAKEGKFDCAVLSLYALLDYHPDDSKERYFEVSLFAEIFNEMLMRDFGFNIYKEIYLHHEPENANNVCESAEIKAEDDTKKGKPETCNENKKDHKEKADEKEKSSKKENNEHHNDDSHSIKSESRKRKVSTSTSVTNSKDNGLPNTDKKMVVVKPQLLLSLVYFDTTHCGYIFDKDLEDLFYILGLNLSRSQIKNILGKFGKSASPQPIYYRKLTDREESLECVPDIEDNSDLPIELHKRIASGNNQYTAILGSCLSPIGNDSATKEGLINFNGTIVHVGKLLNQINRIEKNYSDLEKLYKDLLKQHSDLQKDHSKSSAKVKDLQAEIKNVSRKLTDANQDYYSLNRKYRDQNSSLSYIYTRVAPYFSREKDKEKDSKSEVSHEKDKNDKGKIKEKPKEESEKEVKKEDHINKENDKDANDKDIVIKDYKESIDAEDDEGQGNHKNVKEIDQKNVDEKSKGKDEKEEMAKITDEKKSIKSVKEEGNENIIENEEKEKAIVVTQKVKDKLDKGNVKIQDKEKQKANDDKAKTVTKKNVIGKSKPLTPIIKKMNESKPVVRLVKMSANFGSKK